LGQYYFDTVDLGSEFGCNAGSGATCSDVEANYSYAFADYCLQVPAVTTSNPVFSFANNLACPGGVR
jgi:hypothetical protein